MKPNKRDIEKWCKALRSGEHKQTKYRLQDDKGHCCLGVACDIFIPKTKKELYGDVYLRGRIPWAQSHSPEWLSCIDELIAEKTGKYLTHLNDIYDFSFDEIADILEAVYIHEVLEDQMKVIETLGGKYILADDVFREMDKLKQRLKECEEAVDFYADTMKWSFVTNENGYDVAVITEDDEYRCEGRYIVGGKRARQYKEKYKGGGSDEYTDN